MMDEFNFESLSFGGEVTPILLQEKKDETKITRYGAKN